MRLRSSRLQVAQAFLPVPTKRRITIPIAWLNIATSFFSSFSSVGFSLRRCTRRTTIPHCLAQVATSFFSPLPFPPVGARHAVPDVATSHALATLYPATTLDSQIPRLYPTAIPKPSTNKRHWTRHAPPIPPRIFPTRFAPTPRNRSRLAPRLPHHPLDLRRTPANRAINSPKISPPKASQKATAS